MLQLIIPDISHKEQWEEVMREWGDDWRKNPRICFQNSYEELLTLLRNVQYNDDVNLMIPQSSVYFLFDDSVLVGMYWLRHNLKYHDDALYGGHIGYGIRPSKRKNGYGKEGLALVLGEAKKIGLSKVYLSCDDENIGSVKIIEANGGILEKVFEKVFKEGIIPKRRYWIDLYQEEKELLTSLELELHTSECRQNPERIDELLADDFFECGKTGTMFGKKECLEWLPVEKDKKITACDISVHILSPNIGQVRYMSQIGGDGEEVTTSFRNSLWRKTESGWQMFYHQGTLIGK